MTRRVVTGEIMDDDAEYTRNEKDGTYTRWIQGLVIQSDIAKSLWLKVVMASD